ncbi:unnamed protein product, partial [marine sediment metagenome]
DWDRLDEITDDMIEMARVWHQVNELRKARPGPMHSRDFWTCMNALHYLLGDLKVAIDLYRKVYDEVKYRVDNNIGAVSEEKYRMVFGNLPPWHSLHFFDLLAERGWNFVIETYYHPPKPMDYSKFKNPLERLARFSYQLFTGDLIDARQAEQIGMVEKAIPAADFDVYVKNLAQKLANMPTRAIGMTKIALNRSYHMDLETSQTYAQNVAYMLFHGEDYKEGPKAFLEKRAPVFKGK